MVIMVNTVIMTVVAVSIGKRGNKIEEVSKDQVTEDLDVLLRNLISTFLNVNFTDNNIFQNLMKSIFKTYHPLSAQFNLPVIFL